MATTRPTIKHIVRLSLLERVSPELLVRFLRPFEDYLTARQVRLDGVQYDYTWVGRLYAILTTLDSDMPGELQQGILDVADLASHQGHELALELADERQETLFAPGNDLSVENLAFKLYLEHRGLFVASHARVRSQQAQRFVDFFPRKPQPLPPFERESRRLLAVIQLRRWFAQRNRSKYADLRISETDTEVTFLIIHGRTPQTLSVITSPYSRDRLSFVPDKQDTVLLDKVTGRLSVHAQYPAENDFYRQLIGRIFFGAANHFEPRAVLNCEVLLDNAEEALSADDIEGLDAVALREIALEAGAPTYDQIVWKAPNLKRVLPKALPDLMRHRARTVRYTKLALYFSGTKRAKVVAITPPNKLAYDRRTGDDVVREFLFARGFLRHPVSVPDEPRALS